MTTEQILNSTESKTRKMQMLFELGLTRRQVSEMMGVGYGFVQNVYASTYPERIRRRRQPLPESVFNFTFNRNFGIEIEAYGVDRWLLERKLNEAGINTRAESYNHQTREHWKITGDASIRASQGFEVVSPILNGEDGLSQLLTVCRVLKENNALINKSCGLHVHLDAEDMRTQDWKKLYKNYIRVESTIDSFMPRSRRASNNTYCKSMKTHGSIRAIDNANDLKAIERAITHRDRYYKLNTQSYWRQKSVEYRQHSGTIEFEKITNWLFFVARLTEFSRQGFELQTGNLDELEKFCDQDIINYINDRINKLAS
jgi:hypothetical protein